MPLPTSLLLLVLALASGLAACRPAESRGEADLSEVPAWTAEALVRVRAHEGPRGLGVPLFTRLRAEDALAGEMRQAWHDAGENGATFELHFGERIYSSEAPFDSVRAFYMPYAAKSLMDHAMDFPDLGRQRMFTSLIPTPDGLVKLTLTRPFFPYPSSQAIDRTFLQMGRAGLWRYSQP